MSNESSGRKSLPRARTRGGRRLGPLELEAWTGVLATGAAVTRELDVRLSLDHRLSLREYQLLAALAEARRRRLRMRDVAAAAGLSPSRTTRVVAALEDRGWVERTGAEGDGRGAEAVLTPDGTAALRRARATHDAVVRERFAGRLGERDLRALARAWRALER